MLQNPTPSVIFLMGPTAVGKTALAAALHDLLPVDIISVDAAQVYRGMDIGTAKPSTGELAQTPHRLIDIRDPAEPYSAAEFCADAQREITEIRAHGRIPMLVGGTMFYFHALEYGLSRLPSANPEIRAQLMQETEKKGIEAMHRRLQKGDPQSAHRIHPHDAQRILRALEILEITGKPASLLNRQGPPADFPYRVIKMALMPADREALRKRIGQRFHHMLDAGLVEEVRNLYQRPDLTTDLPALRMVGYRQIWTYLQGKIPYDQMVDDSITATRRLAKRQLTWLRSYAGVKNIDDANPDLESTALTYIKGKLSAIGVY